MIHSVMKVFPVTRWLAALFFTLCLEIGLHAQTELGTGRLPISQISLHRREIAWDLRVYRNGSGSLNFGSSVMDVASFPKGTVDFEALLEAARTRKIVHYMDPACVQVAVRNSFQTTTIAESRAMSADWDALCRQFQPHLEAQFVDRVNDLLKKFPLAEGLPYVPARMPPPTLPQPKRIRVSRGEAGWYVVIRKDGAGCVANDATYGIVAWFPKGTVDFDAMVEQAKNRQSEEAKEAESVTITVQQNRGLEIKGSDTVADWDALCRKIQPHLRSANPEHFNRLMKESPLAKDLPAVSVRQLEPVVKSPAPGTGEDR
jgi:hypothetical protein